MKPLFIMLSFIVVFASFGAAMAEESSSDESHLVNESSLVNDTEIVIRNNVSGIWFPMETARAILADVRELPLLRRQLSLFDQQLQLREQQVTRTNEQLDREVAARESLVESAEEANRRAERAEDRQSAWYRSPAFWYFIGALSTVALVIAGAVILKSVQPSLSFSVSD